MKRMKKETFDNIPEWAIYFLAYGESDELTEEEVDEVTTFTTINFPVGYTMDVPWMCNGTTTASLTRTLLSACPARPIRWTSTSIKR